MAGFVDAANGGGLVISRYYNATGMPDGAALEDVCGACRAQHNVSSDSGDPPPPRSDAEASAVEAAESQPAATEGDGRAASEEHVAAAAPAHQQPVVVAHRFLAPARPPARSRAVRHTAVECGTQQGPCQRLSKELASPDLVCP